MVIDILFSYLFIF